MNDCCANAQAVMKFKNLNTIHEFERKMFLKFKTTDVFLRSALPFQTLSQLSIVFKDF